MVKLMKHDLLQQIQEAMPTLSKSHRAIGQFILENYNKAAYMTAARLGAYVHVSESTVVRFAIELGFDGYPELQRTLRELLRTMLTAPQRLEIINSRIGTGDNMLEKLLAADIDRIKATMEIINTDDFNRAVDVIINAKKIYIIGVRSCTSIASFMTFYFRMFFENVQFVQTESGSEIFEQIFHIGKGDVIIAPSFPRYSKRIVSTLEYAKFNGAYIVSLTDSVDSPIAEFADSLLLAKSDLDSFVNSLVAPLSVANALVTAVGMKIQGNLGEIFSRLENIWEKYTVYEKGSEKQ